MLSFPLCRVGPHAESVLPIPSGVTGISEEQILQSDGHTQIYTGVQLTTNSCFKTSIHQSTDNTGVSIVSDCRVGPITKTRLFKYIENFTSKN